MKTPLRIKALLTLPLLAFAAVNLNPAKTYDSPYLSMEHGSNKAVIHYNGYKDEVLDFGSPMNPEAAKAGQHG